MATATAAPAKGLRNRRLPSGCWGGVCWPRADEVWACFTLYVWDNHRHHISTSRELEDVSVDDALLFIDANKYLDLYQTTHGRSQLAALAEQADNIFVTQQVVEEVRRNKIALAAKFLEGQFNKLKLPNVDLPDHLLGGDADQAKKIRSERKKAAGQINDDLDQLATSIFEKIYQSQDEISETLTPIFAHATPHTAAELQRFSDYHSRANAEVRLAHLPAPRPRPSPDLSQHRPG